jgi:hypothetical protein
MCLPPATKPSPTSVAGESCKWVTAIGEIQLSLYLRGDRGDIGDHHKKRMGKGNY